jgi:hypothetical protein
VLLCLLVVCERIVVRSHPLRRGLPLIPRLSVNIRRDVAFLQTLAIQVSSEALVKVVLPARHGHPIAMEERPVRRFVVLLIQRHGRRARLLLGYLSVSRGCGRQALFLIGRTAAFRQGELATRHLVCARARLNVLWFAALKGTETTLTRLML